MLTSSKPLFSKNGFELKNKQVVDEAISTTTEIKDKLFIVKNRRSLMFIFV